LDVAASFRPENNVTALISVTSQNGQLFSKKFFSLFYNKEKRNKQIIIFLLVKLVSFQHVSDFIPPSGCFEFLSL